jgi:methylase of polypeptide subunit release factors
VLALDGGPDGAAVIRKLLAAFASPAGRAKLKPGAVIFLEIGADQGALVRSAVDEVLPQCGCNVLVDYTGLDRVVVITT